MILMLHVAIALSSILFTTYAYLRPSKTKLNICYGLIAATLTSGTYLVVSTHSPMLSSCASGLIYITAVSLVIIPARKKLAKEQNRI
jgi:hypothetical protein